MAITFACLQIDGVCFWCVHCTFVEHVQETRVSFFAIFCSSMYVSRPSKPAAVLGFNRLRPVANSSRLKGIVSSVGGLLLRLTIVLWCSSSGLLIGRSCLAILLCSYISDNGRGYIVCPRWMDGYLLFTSTGPARSASFRSAPGPVRKT